MRAEPFDLSQSTAEHRKSFEALMVRPYPADVTPADVTVGGVGAIELTVAGQAAEPAVLYFHGGGYVAGSARTGTHLAAELARRTGGRALSVDYRLAPEHPYPAAVEDGLAAYAGLLDSGASPSRVLVAGDSAGGGLAVATLLAAREQGLPQPAAIAVFSPWADISRSGSSMRTKDGADPLFSYDAMGWYAGRYVPAGDRSAPLVSPVFAALAGLPPLLIQAGSHEVLLDDAVRLAANAGRDDDEVPDPGDVAGVCGQQRAGLLEPDALLELQRAHRRDGAEVPVERGRAYAGKPGEVGDPHPFGIVATDPSDRAVDVGRLLSGRPIRRITSPNGPVSSRQRISRSTSGASTAASAGWSSSFSIRATASGSSGLASPAAMAGALPAVRDGRPADLVGPVLEDLIAEQEALAALGRDDQQRLGERVIWLHRFDLGYPQPVDRHRLAGMAGDQVLDLLEQAG